MRTGRHGNITTACGTARAFRLQAIVHCHDAHGFAIVKDVLTPAEVTTFRADIAAAIHPPARYPAGPPPATRLSLQPSVETVGAQQRLLANDRAASSRGPGVSQDRPLGTPSRAP
jgi:hypothetical protein